MKRFCLSFFLVAFGLASLARADDQNRASKILTSEIAQDVLGAPVEPGSRNNAPDTEMGKTWVSRASFAERAESAAGRSVSLLIRHAPSHEEAQSIFESSKATFHGEEVAGLGEAAYRTKVPAQLNILRGNDWLIISAGTLRESDAGAQEKAAREILANLPAG